jgi:hypothetical protein
MSDYSGAVLSTILRAGFKRIQEELHPVQIQHN